MQEEGSNKIEWTIPSDKEKVQEVLLQSLDNLLAPYTPTAEERDSDIQWSTNEIIAALETHYGLPQGDPQASIIQAQRLVEMMTERGFIAVILGA